MHPGQGDQRRGTGAGRLVVARHGRRLLGQFGGASEPTAQCLHQRQPPAQARPFAFPAGSGLGDHPGPEDTGRLVRAAGPQLDRGAAGQYPPPDVRMPGEFPVRDLAEHQLRTPGGRRRRRQVPRTQAGGKPQYRGG